VTKQKKQKKIFTPKGGVDVTATPQWDAETNQPVKVDKQEALRQWLSSAKKEQITEDECYSGLIDPKQAVYAKKERK
jgi:hypothetical protein